MDSTKLTPSQTSSGVELQAPRHQIAEFAEFPHRVGRTDAQPVDVRAALDRRNQIDVALGDGVLGLEHPGERPFE